MSITHVRRIRRSGAVLLSLTALMATACGSSSGPEPSASSGGPADEVQLPDCPVDAHKTADGKVEVVVWHFLQALTRDALEQIAASYNASQDKVTVRVENQGSNNDEVWNKYRSGIAGGDLPGIAILDDTVARQIIDSETILPAQSCIDADSYDMADFLPGAKAFYTKEDVLYPVSLNLSGALLYYNRNHLRRAGIDPDASPKTLDEVRDLARTLKAAKITNVDGTVVEKPVVLQVSPPLIEMLLTGAKVPIVDNDNGRGAGDTTAAAFDTPDTETLFAWLRSMIDEGLLDALPQTPGQVGHYGAMATQRSSMTIETSTAATAVESFLAGTLETDGLPAGVDPSTVNVTDLDIGAAPVPGLREPGKLAMGGGAWYITNTTAPEVQAAAWDFAKYFNEASQQVVWTTVGGYLPYRMSTIHDPAIGVELETTLSGRWLKIAYDELVNGVDPAFPRTLIGPYDDTRTAFRMAIDELIFNNASPQAVIDQAAADTNSALEKYNKGA